MRARLNDDVFMRARLNDDVFMRARLNDDVFRISIDYILELLARFARSPINRYFVELIIELNPNFAHKQHTPLGIKLQRDFFRITQE